jgi:hypothetical protein
MRTDLEIAWDAVYEVLPTSWDVGPITYDPERGVYGVLACGPCEGGGRRRRSVTGSGASVVTALRDLEQRLFGLAELEAQRDELIRRLRLAYVEGAESFSRFDRGRPLSACELEGVLALFEG